ncbi:mitochondrial outer membrane protein porin 2-like [Juglans microcarpa x Juglans regia]|uniref:mitochondrial outer membrane protein porin 2-like n=1 Tax=Juglans microcarpa x Juglans regia TaxID=2249226 RepID=UPI001B7E9DD7|nr:mitochondrial outer membrane protein porin 2-like [Juglans microcarpa x Juglans regia]XP_041017047.1 mitochondrial outer membrane protein porin 2-like [Juglans microcarpa x Juglans regia]
MAKNGPGLFSDIGKKARDLLTKDYDCDQTFTITTITDTGVALSSTVAKKGGLSSGHVAAQYKHKNAVLDVKVDTESNVLTTFTLTDIPLSTKTIASFKLPDYKSGKLEAQYCHEHATFTTAVGLNQSPAFDFSATIGTPSISFGAEASYATASRNFAKYNAGVSLTKPDSSASVILADKGDSLRVSYLHHLSRLNGGAVAGEISRRFSTNENTLTVGCSYVVDPHTVVKAKLNNHGNLGALLRHKLVPNSFLTVSGAVDTKNLEKHPKFGLALSLKP